MCDDDLVNIGNVPKGRFHFSSNSVDNIGLLSAPIVPKCLQNIFAKMNEFKYEDDLLYKMADFYIRYAGLITSLISPAIPIPKEQKGEISTLTLSRWRPRNP